MSDSVVLLVDGKRIEHFERYAVEADIYTADDAFSLDVANPEHEIQYGRPCELYVEGELALSGIVDRVTRDGDRQGNRLKVEGRDLMGLLVDSYCERFRDVEGLTLKQLAELLIGPDSTVGRPAIPFISRSQIVYQENVVGKLKGKKQTVSQPLTGFIDTPQKISRIEPGMTVFEVLRTYAASRGMMFWLQYRNGRAEFVFGRPMAAGDAQFSITRRRDGRGNNVLDGELTEDISKRYSKITVISQGQGYDSDGADPGKVNSSATRTDAEFPFYKPFVTRLTNDSQSPALHARLLQEKQRHEGFQLTYRVPRHTQDGRVWAVNELCTVRDEVLGLDGTYLIFGRTFEMSKEGTFTRLKLGYPGVMA